MKITNEEMRAVIHQIILHQNGIKRVNLIMKVMEVVNPHRFDVDMFNKELDNLKDEITEIKWNYESFILPNNIKIEICK